MLEIFPKKNFEMTAWGELQRSVKWFYDWYMVDSIIAFKTMQYFYPEISNEAQNEICRMILDEEKSEIYCYEIWEKNPKSFHIRGSLESLKAILEKLRVDKDKFRTLKELEKLYVKMTEKTEMINVEKVDINNADLDEIRKIKGINIVIAKRIIKKREEIGGFKSVNDVVVFSSLRYHAAEILREQIKIEPMKIFPAQIRYDVRNVDL